VFGLRVRQPYIAVSKLIRLFIDLFLLPKCMLGRKGRISGKDSTIQHRKMVVQSFKHRLDKASLKNGRGSRHSMTNLTDGNRNLGLCCIDSQNGYTDLYS
jgi:hypothetical protein